jgi:hypothetical protein
MASLRWGLWARYLSVTSGSPSRIMRWTMMRLLKTMVQVESRRRLVRARKISATPASPACVATSMCSTYFDFGAASYAGISGAGAGERRGPWAMGHGRRAGPRLTAHGGTQGGYLDLGAALDALLERTRHGNGLGAWRRRRRRRAGVRSGRGQRAGALASLGRSGRGCVVLGGDWVRRSVRGVYRGMSAGVWNVTIMGEMAVQEQEQRLAVAWTRRADEAPSNSV